MQEALQQRYLLMAQTYQIDIETLQQGALLYDELWTIGSWSHDQVQLNVELRGPGDAARAVSLRILQQSIVGNIPASGQLVIA
jgi:hypothetical protein